MKGRPERLLELLDEAKLDALLVTGRVNVRYLTGFTGSNGLAVVGPRTRAFVTDFRYVERAAAEVHPSFERRLAARELLDVVPEALPAGELRLGFEDADLTVQQFERLKELLPEQVQLLAADSLVERLRAVKEPGEIVAIGAAGELADAAFERLLAGGLIGRTERELVHALEREMVDRGAARAGFETIVAAGPNGARPHAEARDVEIRRGDLVVIDWGAELDGYRSDCTRTIAVGEPGVEARDVYALVLAAQQAGLQAIRAGASGRSVDSTARDVIGAAGHGGHFGHGLGHGVGLEIHERPRLGQRSEDELVAGNVVTVEPGVYLPGRFGVRIEDLTVVGEVGCDVLTGLGKELVVV